jgi:hypothetical protein
MRARSKGGRWLHAAKRSGVPVLFVFFLLRVLLAVVVCPALFVRTAAQAQKTVDCTGHDECRASEFCAEASCFKVEGFEVLCGECRSCTECVNHFESIDRTCPKRCGPPSQTTEYLQGRFYSTDGRNCLTLWTFEGLFFQRYRTNLNSTLVHRGLFLCVCIHICGAGALMKPHLQIILLRCHV